MSNNAILFCDCNDVENIRNKIDLITSGRIVVKAEVFNNPDLNEKKIEEIIKHNEIVYGIIAANATGLQVNNNIWRYINLFEISGLKRIRIIPSALVKKDYSFFSYREKHDFLTPVKKWRELPVAKILLSESCNLNCSGCTHFIPLNSKQHNISLSEYTRYIVRLKKLFEYIKEINLLGGEPLLNKDLAQIITTTKTLLPYTDISIITNGILVKNMSEELTEIIRENKVFFLLTRYIPLDSSMDDICKFLLDHGIPYLVSGKVSEFRLQYNLSGSSNAENVHHSCLDQYCHTINDDKIYNCYFPATVKWANSYFGIELPYKNEGIDLFSARRRDASRIVRQLSQPMNICKYCNGFNNIKTIPWKQYEPNDDIHNWFTE